MFQSSLRHRRFSSFRGPRHRPAPARYRARLRLEPLESRDVPSAVLDPSFNGSGLQTVALNFGGPLTGALSPRAVVLQPDGKILVAGSALTSGGTADYAVARLNADGSADASFGSGGTVVVPLPFVGIQAGGDIALQPDGRIVLAGTTNTSGGPGEFAVFRLDANGSVDTTFGSGGEVVVPFTNSETTLAASATAVAIDASGKVVVAGPATSSPSPFGPPPSFAVARLNPDGSLDASFGAGGTEAISLPASGTLSLPGLAFQPGGQIVLAGSLSTPSLGQSSSQFVVARLNASDGSVDPTFGGVLLFGFGRGGSDIANALAIQPDGRIVVAGGAGLAGNHSLSALSFSDFAVARLNPDGTFDGTFQSNTGLPGRRYIQLKDGGPPYFDAASGVALAPDGGILLDGNHAGGMAFVRLNGDGSLAAHGTVPFPNQALTAGPLTVQPDGKVVAAGAVGVVGSSNQSLLVARLSGVANVAQAVGVFDPASATWYLRSSAGPGAPDAGQFRYGGGGWLPVVGRWSGTARPGIGVYDPTTATWYLHNAASAGAPDAGLFAYGVAGWFPVVGDWNNSGQTGIGVYDPTTATWYLRSEPGAGAPDAGVFRYGFTGAIPVVGDWTGTGHLGIGVFDPSTATWFLRSSLTAGPPDVGIFQYGGPGWLPVVGDWAGAGHAGVGVFDPATAIWYLHSAAGAGFPDAGVFAYGGAGWLPVTGAFAPQFLLAAGGEGAGAAALTDAELQSAVAGALARLSAAGVSPALLSNLASATYAVGSLPPGVLGQAAAGRVTLSADGAGRGWFADATPLRDEEFAPGSPLVALPGSAAAGKEDLLSAVLHEMGHLAGSTDGGTGLMAGALAPGTRDLAALDSVFAQQPL